MNTKLNITTAIFVSDVCQPICKTYFIVNSHRKIDLLVCENAVAVAHSSLWAPDKWEAGAMTNRFIFFKSVDSFIESMGVCLRN